MNTLAAEITDNVRRVSERIARAAAAAGRRAAEITLVAVTKTRTVKEIRAAADAGVTVFGENRVQEAETKIPALADLRARWHLVGHLQRNKAARAVTLFDYIQTVDSERLATALNVHAENALKRIPVLIEVNTSGEDAKFGVPPAAAADLAAFVSLQPRLALEGLMTVGPLTTDVRAITAAFRELRRRFDEVKPAAGAGFKHLSMGMTDDFELAIAEGSTMVRIGRAIFGPR
jgi:pyridoxal phosphate enzyme (YggS family)